ncbi:CusA/CzcA family heavy metal efflux RND transporter [Leptobacterium flavescens]|uniref:CusA/CzcA family heavy metal efflux RND transporter n=1 Tax=Leptobacterium flavescens TaxID=472055 RepID=A0A6P0UF16_9FLAO|nr:CusA/CzcA family heavy metal efflux RND transporter [Leptobacterium flavescens]NER11835.1 CusA/CzcA family heavy metal efflux RND transporter [Leptobacterium flavescens]
MINKLIDFSINNKFIIGLFTLALILAGIWSVGKVPIDAVPDITNNQVQVITQAPNLGTEDIEQFVTYPVEIAMSNLPDVQEIRSISRFGLSVVTIVFKDDVGTYLPRQLVAEKLTEIRSDIPEGFGEPSMGPISTGLGEIYQYTLEVSEEYKGKYSITDLRSVQDWIIRRQMAMVPGVVEVNAFGGGMKQYEVAVNPGQLKTMGLTISDVFTALENNNQNTGGAYIEKNHQANFIRSEGLARSLEDIENTVIKNINGLPVKIKDIAKVGTGTAVRYGALTKDGKGEAVGGMILMLKGANSDAVIAKVSERMEQIQKSLPEGIVIKPFLDRSQLIASTTGTVKGNLMEGGLIVIFVLVLLLGNWRGGLIVASTIPLSLLFAFILMNVFDVWANLMSLGAIDFGIIVDGAVIIVEGTVFLLYSKMNRNAEISRGERDKLTSTASKKMMNSAFFGQLIILIVFLPILALEGVEGKMFKPMALTFIFAMLGAMILCLTYVPMVSALFLKVSRNKKNSWGDRFVGWVENKYESALKKALKRTKWIVGATVAILAIAAFAFSRMGGEFIPQLDEGDLAFHAILKPGSSLSETIETTTKIEQLVKAEFPEAESVVSRIGVADVPTDPMPMDIADIFVILKPVSEWTSAGSKEELVEKMKNTISIIPGVNYEFTQPIEMRFNELLTGVREDVAVKLFGEDLDTLAAKAEEMGKIISTVDGVADFKVEALAGLPQITVAYDRNKLAQYGLEISNLNMLIQSAFAGGKAGVIFEGEKRYDLVVRLDKNYRSDIDDLRSLFVNLPNGAQIPMRELADISYKSGPIQISRDNTNRRTYVGINIRGRDVKSVVEEIEEKLDAQLELPPGYYIRYGGAFENLQRAGNKLKTVVPIALVLIFILIFFALRSFSQTLMIYMAIPLAAIGGVFALWLRGMPFSISAGVGFIVLFGVAVLNGLVMISGLNELKEEGELNLKERIMQGTKRRIRPIMLTAFTDILGFLPMAVSASAGAEVQRPLATVVIGGLITSTLLTLFILPMLYKWVEQSNFSFKLNKKAVVTAAAGCFLLLPLKTTAQEQDSLPKLSLSKMVELSRESYPLLKAKQLELEQQKTLKRSAWDLGQTRIFTGGEEIGGGDEVYTTIGLQQQNIAVFSVSPRLKLQAERIRLAEKALELSGLELEKEVKKAWIAVFSAKRKLLLYRKLDSTYLKLERAIELNYETEAISRLEFSSAKNQVIKNRIRLDQANSDYIIALQKLNAWLVSDEFYTVEDNLDPAALVASDAIAPEDHPAMALSQLQISEAEADYKLARANLLPKLNLQGGLQRVSGNNSLYTYQLGVSVPLFSGSVKGKARTAKLKRDIAKENAVYNGIQFRSEYQQLYQRYLKWQKAWQFYENEALPLSREQQKGALLAYREGAVNYTTFNQILRDAVQTELNAIDALNSYTASLFELQFYNPKI